MRISEEDKRHKVHGILSIIEPCSHVLEVTLPLQKDNGQFEMITGKRKLKTTPLNIRDFIYVLSIFFKASFLLQKVIRADLNVFISISPIQV